MISIHALREEGDARRRAAQRRRMISIHALREEGDLFCHGQAGQHLISIHALREEGDIPVTTSCWKRAYFYPRPPRGGRPTRQIYQQLRDEISIHALREEGDEGSNTVTINVTAISIHALREEGDTHVYPFWMSTEKFLSTPSARRATYQVSLHC